MRMKILPGVTVSRTSRAEAAEIDRLVALREQVFARTPALREDGRARYADVGRLVDRGWSDVQILDLVQTWPEADAVTMTILFSAAEHISGSSDDTPEQVIAWLRALLHVDGSAVVPRPIVRTTIQHERRSLPYAVELWTLAAGSRHDGLVALQDGLSIEQTRERFLRQ